MISFLAHAEHKGVDVEDYASEIGGTVMRRVEDGRYAFVHIHQRPRVTVAAGQAEQARELIGKAERGPAAIEAIRKHKAAYLMAVGGAYLTMSAFDAFYFGMINGRGWICVALVIFARWDPVRCLWASLLFGAAGAILLRRQRQ